MGQARNASLEVLHDANKTANAGETSELFIGGYGFKQPPICATCGELPPRVYLPNT